MKLITRTLCVAAMLCAWPAMAAPVIAAGTVADGVATASGSSVKPGASALVTGGNSPCVVGSSGCSLPVTGAATVTTLTGPTCPTTNTVTPGAGQPFIETQYGYLCVTGPPGPAGVIISSVGDPAASLLPHQSTALEGSHVWSTSAANGYDFAVTTGASAGFLELFDLAADPPNGAVQPILCRAVPANSSVEIDRSLLPIQFAIGVVEVLSTGADCLHKTESATGFLEASYVKVTP